MAGQSFNLRTVLCYVTGKNFPGPPEHQRLAGHLIFDFLAHLTRTTPVVTLVRGELCRQFPALLPFVGIECDDETREGIFEKARAAVGETLVVEPATLFLRDTQA